MTTLATIKETESKLARLNITGFDVVRVVLALILLVAAALKAHQLATEPVANNGIFSYRWSLMAMVEFEIVLGLWLLSGLHKRLVWFVSTSCFSLFTCITLYKALSGEASCGCFGTVEVSPWYTLTLDVAAVVALSIFRPNLHRPERANHYWLRFAVALVIVLAAGIPAGLAMDSYTPAALTAEGQVTGDSEFVVLEPQEWTGKQFPLIDHIDIGSQLAKGDWVVLLYHHDCPQCAEAVPAYEQMGRELAGNENYLRIAIIEVPPYGPNKECKDCFCLHGSLSNTKDWFVATPVVALLSNGEVRIAWEAKTTDLDMILQNMACMDNQNGR